MAFERSLPDGLAKQDPVVFTRGDEFAELWLNRPEKLNATTETMVRMINDALADVEERPPRVLVLAGAGRAFCAGRDLSEANPEDEDAEAILTDVYNPLILRLATLETITVGAIHGAALGTGLGLALSCDLVIASATSRWGSPFARIGAVLDSGGHYFFQRLGAARAFDLILLGDLLDGRAAFDCGLVSRVVDDADFDEGVAHYVRQVANGPTQAFLASKRILNEERLPALTKILSLEAKAQGVCAKTGDYRLGIRAFVEHQNPLFTGR
ncbi:enoyl-CoA hydratase-related protein [Ferrimicrobium sp.]|uniref:enoyl-CoA hydratase/isomerase family protein n=1 Tax=Ferrimicrobium sp. TaxID=2926050 RepID=UPI00262DA7B2|nr:enoyl-CoA hydratase-related protein [Ferrimicrobium sp.]